MGEGRWGKERNSLSVRCGEAPCAGTEAHRHKAGHNAKPHHSLFRQCNPPGRTWDGAAELDPRGCGVGVQTPTTLCILSPFFVSLPRAQTERTQPLQKLEARVALFELSSAVCWDLSRVGGRSACKHSTGRTCHFCYMLLKYDSQPIDARRTSFSFNPYLILPYPPFVLSAVPPNLPLPDPSSRPPSHPFPPTSLFLSLRLIPCMSARRETRERSQVHMYGRIQRTHAPARAHNFSQAPICSHTRPHVCTHARACQEGGKEGGRLVAKA